LKIEDPIQYLTIADPELAEKVENALAQKSETVLSSIPHSALEILAEEAVWGLSQETSFGYTIAMGFADLIGETSPDQIQKYRERIREAGENNGPTLGRLMAEYLVPVLKYGTNGLLEQFFHTVDIMQTKGTYTLKSPLETLSSLLNTGDIESAPIYLGLLRDTFSQEMSYNQSLHLTHVLPKAVRSFSLPKRNWQLEQFRQVMQTDFRLTDPFLDGMEKGLHLLSKDALNRFISLGLEKFKQNKNFGVKFLSLVSRNGIEAYTEMVVTVSLSQVRHSLNRYLRARTGILQLSVAGCGLSVGTNNSQQTADSKQLALSDGKFIYLPDEIDIFNSKAENLNLYKCLAKLEAAYYEFGTFDFDLEKVDCGLWGVDCGVRVVGCRSSVPTNSKQPATDLEKFFLRFPIKELAADLFTIFEHGRIRILLKRFYPGIVRQFFPILRDEAIRIFREEKPPIESIFLLYVRIALGLSASEIFGTTEFDLHIEKFADVFEERMEKDQLVEACAELVFRTYPEGETLIRKTTDCENLEESYTPLKTPFGRKPRPDLFFSAFQHIEKMAETIKIRLEQAGANAYKSDIRKHLTEKDCAISAEDIREVVLKYGKDNPQGSGNVSVNLSPEVIRKILNHPEIRTAHAELEQASGPVSWYREWDWNLGDYLHNHVRVLDRFISSPASNESRKDFYQETLKRHYGLVRRIRRAFELLKPEGLTILRQWVEGDEFDYRAMLDFAMDKKAGIMPSDRLYIKRIKQERNVAVLLLVDLSRSTSNQVFGSQSSVLDLEKEAIALFCEALQVLGDSFAIAGFSGTGRLGTDYFRIKEFGEAMDDAVKYRINSMSPQRSTRMGAAIRHGVSQLEKVSAKVRLLIILGDGFPNDTDYKREYAIEDTRRAISEARSKSIYTKAITVNIAGDSKLDDLYGAFHHNVISDVRELPDKLLRIYSALTR
jgi:hypothetical protein